VFSRKIKAKGSNAADAPAKPPQPQL
jgi:hypothetical protein